MKYMCILLASLFITSCDKKNDLQTAANLMIKAGKCIINNSNSSDSEKKDSLTNFNKQSSEFKQKIKDNCNNEDIEKIIKLNDCIAKECEKYSSDSDNEISYDGLMNKCEGKLNVRFKSLTESCFKTLDS